MKKAIIAAAAAILVAGTAIEAKSVKPETKKAVYLTSLDCQNCAKKIRENISFEKGVKDLKVDVPTKTVEVIFDLSKTDTLKLRKAINKLGYDAKVIEYK